MNLRISIAELDARRRAGEGFAFVDARSVKSWAAASEKVPTAIRIPPDEVEEHLADLPLGKPVVAYCT